MRLWLVLTCRTYAIFFVGSVYERRSLVPRQEKNDFHLPPYSDNKDVSCESSVVEELRTHVEVLQEQVGVISFIVFDYDNYFRLNNIEIFTL